MSSNYRPSETSGLPDLAGALTPQAERDYADEVPFQFALNAGQGRAQEGLGWGMGAPQPGNAFGSYDYVGVLGDYGQQMAASREPEPPPIGSITRKADGTTDLKGVSSSFLEDVMGQMTDLKTMKAAAMARVAQLRQQESSGSPILDALSQFAGGMAANDPTMPGWVRALGQTNLQMGNQGIAAKRKGEEAKAFAYGKEITDTSLAAARLQDEQTQRQFVESQKQASVASIAEKSKIDATFKIHDDAVSMIEKSSVFDVHGTAKKMVAMGIPEDQIIAEIEGLQQYADDRAKAVAKLKAAEAKEDNAKEVSRARAMLAVVDARGDITERRIQAKEEAEMRGRAHSFNMKVLSESKPSAVVDTSLRESSQALDTIEKAKAMLDPKNPENIRGKFGFGKGWLLTRKVWRGSEEQKMLSVSIDTLSESAKAAGLKPLSDTDLRLLRDGILDPNKSPDANDEVVRQVETKIKNLVTQIMEYNQGVDWAAKANGLPKFARGKIPELMERRKTYFSQYAPPGSEIPETPFTPEAPPVKLPADFLAALKKQPAGRGLKYNGVGYLMVNGKPVKGE
jgi:hypothetical protein